MVDASAEKRKYWQAMTRIQSWGSFFLQLALAAVLVALVDVGVGVLYCAGRLPATRHVARWLAYGFALLIFAFALAQLVKYEIFYAEYYAVLFDTGSSGEAPDPAQLRPYTLLGTASTILLCVAFAVQAVLSGVLVAVVRQGVEHRKVGTYTTKSPEARIDVFPICIWLTICSSSPLPYP